VGSEVKSIAAGKVNLTDAYCRIENGEMWVQNMHISPYDPAARFNHDPRRKRKLLMHRWEIDRIQGKVEQKGFTLVLFPQWEGEIRDCLSEGQAAI